MPLMNIEDPRSGPDPRVALFNLGFRPFFLFAGIAALLLMAVWLYLYTRGRVEPGYYGAVAWHSHEMVFGYTVAVIAGFLLTAVRNWTGIQTPRGIALAGLVVLWLAGRVMPAYSADLPLWLVAADQLRDHIRFEEQVLFPRAEKLMDAEALARVAALYDAVQRTD